MLSGAGAARTERDFVRAQKQVEKYAERSLGMLIQSFLGALSRVDKNIKDIEEVYQAVVRHRERSGSGGGGDYVCRNKLNYDRRKRLKDMWNPAKPSGEHGAGGAAAGMCRQRVVREKELSVEEYTEEDFDPASGVVRSRKRRRTTEKSRELRMTEIGLFVQQRSLQQDCRRLKIELLGSPEPMAQRLAAAQQQYLLQM